MYEKTSFHYFVNEKGQLGYLIDGNCSIHHRLPLKEGVADSFLIFGKGMQQRSVEFKTLPSLIFNQIADPDTHRGALERCIQLCEQINTTVAAPNSAANPLEGVISVIFSPMVAITRAPQIINPKTMNPPPNPKIHGGMATFI